MCKWDQTQPDVGKRNDNECVVTLEQERLEETRVVVGLNDIPLSLDLSSPGFNHRA